MPNTVSIFSVWNCLRWDTEIHFEMDICHFHLSRHIWRTTFMAPHFFPPEHLQHCTSQFGHQATGAILSPFAEKTEMQVFVPLLNCQWGVLSCPSSLFNWQWCCGKMQWTPALTWLPILPKEPVILYWLTMWWFRSRVWEGARISLILMCGRSAILPQPDKQHFVLALNFKPTQTQNGRQLQNDASHQQNQDQNNPTPQNDIQKFHFESAFKTFFPKRRNNFSERKWVLLIEARNRILFMPAGEPLMSNLICPRALHVQNLVHTKVLCSQHQEIMPLLTAN